MCNEINPLWNGSLCIHYKFGGTLWTHRLKVYIAWCWYSLGTIQCPWWLLPIHLFATSQNMTDCKACLEEWSPNKAFSNQKNWVKTLLINIAPFSLWASRVHNIIKFSIKSLSCVWTDYKSRSLFWGFFCCKRHPTQKTMWWSLFALHIPKGIGKSELFSSQVYPRARPRVSSVLCVPVRGCVQPLWESPTASENQSMYVWYPWHIVWCLCRVLQFHKPEKFWSCIEPYAVHTPF